MRTNRTDLVLTTENLPDNLDDLAKFVLIGQEKAKVVRAEIKAIHKLKLAKEVERQKAKELQMLTEALIDAQIMIGRLTPKIPKSSGRPNNSSSHYEEFRNPSAVQNNSSERSEELSGKESKNDIVKKMGFSVSTVNEFEQMAANPDVVEEVKQEAREKGEPVTRSAIIKRIRENRKDDVILDATSIFKPNKASILNEFKEKDLYFKIFDTLTAVFDLFNNAPIDEYARIYVKCYGDCATKDDHIASVQLKIDLMEQFRDAIKNYKSGKVIRYENQ